MRMAAGEYSFIDISVLEEIRGHFAAGEPLVLLTPDLEHIVWANGPGAQFLGYRDVEAAMGSLSRLEPVQRRQIKAVPGYPAIGRDRAVHLRLGTGFSTRSTPCRVSQVRLPDGKPALLLVIPQVKAGEGDASARAISNIGNGGKYAALVGGEGEIIAETQGLSQLGVSHTTLSQLIRQVRHERDRLVKRMIEAGSGQIAAGVGRLSEVPPLHLLVLVSDMPSATTEAPLEAAPASGVGEVPAEPIATQQIARPEEFPATVPVTEPKAQPPTDPISPAPAASMAPEQGAAPLHFSWRTDRDGRLSELSDEFLAAFGSSSTGMIGKRFSELAEQFGMEDGGKIDGLLQRRDTWSGRTVLWPVGDRRIRVDLAALPAYDRERRFDGFRGFGVAHPEESLPLVPASAPDERAPDRPEAEKKVIRLEERRNGGKRTLSETERSAFQEIAARLRKDAEEAAEPVTKDPVPEKPTEPAAEAENRHEQTVPPEHIPAEAAAADAAATHLFQQLPLALVVRTQEGQTHANAEFLRLTGYASDEEFLGSGGLDTLFGEPCRMEGEEHPARHLLSLRTRDGREYPCEAALKSIDWGGGHGLMLAIRRVETGQDEQRLRERIEELTAILDTATDGVVLIRPDGTIRSANHSAEALFGRETDALAGKPFTSLFAIESQSLAADYLNGLTGNGVASILNDGREVIAREAKGGYIPLFMTIGRLPGPGGFCAVLRDITQWKRAEEELVQARGIAERASTQKTGFLARISHEIRTPLNAIIGFSELMMDERFGTIGNERYREYLRDINRSGNHVLELVNDLLDISKIEAGEQEMQFEAVSLNDSLADAVAMMQPEANRERVIIRSSFASGLPDVVADRRSIKQIALNLLSNAIRFTPPGGQVIVSTALESGGNVILRVRDTGIGMSQPEIEHALKPFKQVTRMQKRQSSGTGLGLPLTKAMVEANRAVFAIESEPEEGTIVEIVFPATRVLAG